MECEHMWGFKFHFKDGTLCRCVMCNAKHPTEHTLPDAPKPATPEPPEWKGIKFQAIEPTPEERAVGFIGRMVGADGSVVRITADEYFKPPSNLTDVPTVNATGSGRDPVTDFIARRVAKREALTREVQHMKPPKWKGGLADAIKIGDLARAMSQPGPHDTDIHTRLMPWRGR